MSDLSAYKQDISRCHEMVDADEMERLTLEWQKKGDEDARDRVFNALAPLAFKIAGNTDLPPGVERSDAVQEANLGILRALDQFEPGRGAKVSSYAALKVFNSIRNSIVRKSVNSREIQPSGAIGHCRSTHRGSDPVRCPVDPVSLEPEPALDPDDMRLVRDVIRVASKYKLTVRQLVDYLERVMDDLCEDIDLKLLY